MAVARRVCPRRSYIIGLPCLPALPEAPTAPSGGTEVTAGDIERAVREVGLPALGVHIEPAGETLVNLPTNLFTRPQSFARTVDVLGAQVDLRAVPVAYVWHHGDGTQQTTSSPGQPYPQLEVTHRYERPGEGLLVRVDVSYQVEYSIDSGPWRSLESTITATGAPTAITVREAVPVLVQP